MLATVSACSSGGHLLAAARRLIAGGRVDAVLCGAADASIHPLIVGSYGRLGLLASPDDAVRGRCRAFHPGRKGFFIGEGAAAFVLVSPTAAERLGIQERARLIGCAAGATAFDAVRMPTDGHALAHVITVAMADAGVSPEHIDLVVAHGTATRDGDLNEFRGLSTALGRVLSRVPVLATKWLHGHLLGAACAAELSVLLRVMTQGRLGPHVALDEAGKGTWRQAAERPVRVALKVSAGFGGHISASNLQTSSRL